MRVKFYFLAVSLCCTLPFMAQGGDLEPVGETDPPRVSLKSIRISPIVIETESGMLNLYFTRDLGEVYAVLQPLAGKADYFQSIDTSIQDQAVLVVPAGTYILTVTDTAGNVIKQESIIIP